MSQLRWYQILLSKQTAVKNHTKFRGLLTSVSRLNMTSMQNILLGTVRLQLKQLSYLSVPLKNMLPGKGGSMSRPPKTRQVTIQMRTEIEKAGKM